MCDLCHLGSEDDVKHLMNLMNSLVFCVAGRKKISNEIESIPDGSCRIMLNSQCSMLMALLGKGDSSLTPAQLDPIWRILYNWLIWRGF